MPRLGDAHFMQVATVHDSRNVANKIRSPATNSNAVVPGVVRSRTTSRFDQLNKAIQDDVRLKGEIKTNQLLLASTQAHVEKCRDLLVRLEHDRKVLLEEQDEVGRDANELLSRFEKEKGRANFREAALENMRQKGCEIENDCGLELVVINPMAEDWNPRLATILSKRDQRIHLDSEVPRARLQASDAAGRHEDTKIENDNRVRQIDSTSKKVTELKADVARRKEELRRANEHLNKYVPEQIMGIQTEISVCQNKIEKSNDLVGQAASMRSKDNSCLKRLEVDSKATIGSLNRHKENFAKLQGLCNKEKAKMADLSSVCDEKKRSVDNLNARCDQIQASIKDDEEQKARRRQALLNFGVNGREAIGSLKLAHASLREVVHMMTEQFKYACGEVLDICEGHEAGQNRLLEEYKLVKASLQDSEQILKAKKLDAEKFDTEISQLENIIDQSKHIVKAFEQEGRDVDTFIAEIELLVSFEQRGLFIGLVPANLAAGRASLKSAVVALQKTQEKRLEIQAILIRKKEKKEDATTQLARTQAEMLKSIREETRSLENDARLVKDNLEKRMGQLKLDQLNLNTEIKKTQKVLEEREKKKAEEAATKERERKQAEEEAAAGARERKRAEQEAAARELERKKAEEQAAAQERERKRNEEEAAARELERKKAQEEAAAREIERKKAEEEAAARELERKKAEEEAAARDRERKEAEEEAAIRERERKEAQEEAAARERGRKKANEEKADRELETKRIEVEAAAKKRGNEVSAERKRKATTTRSRKMGSGRTTKTTTERAKKKKAEEEAAAKKRAAEQFEFDLLNDDEW